MTHPMLPCEQGLYDPNREHDACGVGFVAHIKGKKSHSIVEHGLLILRNLTHRGAVGADPLAGDGAGHPDPDPGPVLPRRDGQAGRQPAAARASTAWAWCSCRRSPPRGSPASTRSSARSRTRARCCSAGAMCRATTPAWASRSSSIEPVIRQVFIGRGAGRHGDRRAGAQALHHPQVLRPRHPGAQAGARQGVLRAVHVGAHHRLQGHAAGRPGRQLLQGPAGPARGLGAGAGAPALLDQHLPDLGPGASVPDDRAQRRDQHPARQRQLDPRAPGRHLQSRCWARTWTRSGR